MPGLTLTLTTGGTVYNVWSLIKAVSGHTNDAGACRELTIKGDSGNGAGKVYLGDMGVSSTNYGLDLIAGQSQTWRSAVNDVNLGLGVVTDTSGSKINVDWSYA